MNRKLDYNLDKAEILQLSNDAYFCLAYSEPCLDESNMEEVQEFKSRFKYGYKFDEQYGIDFVEDSDMIECKVIPICESSESLFTHYKLLGKYFKEEFYYNADKTQANYRIYDMYSGRFIEYGWLDVTITKQGASIYPGSKNSFCPLYGKNWLRY